MSDDETRPEGAKIVRQDTRSYGVQGMAGNVTEWVFDWYFSGYAGLGTLNPTGPDSQPLANPIKVARGGNFTAISAYARTGHRFSLDGTSTAQGFGFRCAADVGGEASRVGFPAAKQQSVVRRQFPVVDDEQAV